MVLLTLVLTHDARAGAPSACRPRDSATLVANKQARVYTRVDPQSARGFAVFGCALATRIEVPLDFPEEGVYAFMPPAMALSKTVVGYATDSCGTSIDQCTTNVSGVDLREGFTTKGWLQDLPASPDDRQPLVKVGSLVIGPSGSVAWTVCPEPAAGGEVLASPQPTCVRPGALDYVVRATRSAGTPAILDSGPKLAPRSLKLQGSRLSWRDGRMLRRASLR